MAGDAAERMSDRLRADLKAAMRARDTVATATIRMLLGAIDNAQAVPVDPVRRPSAMNKFGESAIEVPRLELSPDDVQAVLRGEIERRRSMAEEIRGFGRSGEADRAIAEAEIIRRYLG
jgi:uncharacterized protein YqeY